MTKVTLNCAEKLVYERTVEVLLPDGMSEGKFEALLDRIEENIGIALSLKDFLYILANYGVKIGAYDEDFYNPDRQEVECIAKYVTEDSTACTVREISERFKK